MRPLGWLVLLSWSAFIAVLLRLRFARRKRPLVDLAPIERVFSDKMFDVSNELATKLEQQRASYREADEVERELDAFLLDPGLGPPTYLLRDGRVVWECDIWHVRDTAREAYVSIAVGAHKTGVRELLALLPACPHDGRECPKCRGAHWEEHTLADSESFCFVCQHCSGLGWVATR